MVDIQPRQYALEESPTHSQTSTMTSDKKYCICRSNDDTGFMILCEKCDEWFHGSCIQITQAEADGIRRYYCNKCIARYPTLKIRYKKSAMKNASRGYREKDLEEDGLTVNDDSEPPCTTKQYYVGDILDKKTFEDGKIRYLVKWAEYDSDENSWEPPSNLAAAQYIVERFERHLKRRENGEKSSTDDSGDDDKENESTQSTERRSDESGSSEDSSGSSSSETEQDPPGDDDRDTDEIDDEGSMDDEQDGGEEDSPRKEKEKGNAEGKGTETTETPEGEFCLLDDLPAGFQPTKMLLALPLRKGGLCYMVECMNNEEELEPVFVYAEIFRKTYPLLVIEFYEQHIRFTTDVYPSDDEDFSDCQSDSDPDASELVPDNASEEVMEEQEQEDLEEEEEEFEEEGQEDLEAEEEEQEDLEEEEEEQKDQEHEDSEEEDTIPLPLAPPPRPLPSDLCRDPHKRKDSAGGSDGSSSSSPGESSGNEVLENVAKRKRV